MPSKRRRHQTRQVKDKVVVFPILRKYVGENWDKRKHPNRAPITVQDENGKLWKAYIATSNTGYTVEDYARYQTEHHNFREWKAANKEEIEMKLIDETVYWQRRMLHYNSLIACYTSLTYEWCEAHMEEPQALQIVNALHSLKLLDEQPELSMSQFGFLRIPLAEFDEKMQRLSKLDKRKSEAKELKKEIEHDRRCHYVIARELGSTTMKQYLAITSHLQQVEDIAKKVESGDFSWVSKLLALVCRESILHEDDDDIEPGETMRILNTLFDKDAVEHRKAIFDKLPWSVAWAITGFFLQTGRAFGLLGRNFSTPSTSTPT